MNNVDKLDSDHVLDRLDDLGVHDSEREAWASYCDHMGIDLIDDHEEFPTFEDNYRGHWPREEDYAEELADDLYGEVVESGYFDYEKFSRDIFLCDMFSIEASGYGVYVFVSH